MKLLTKLFLATTLISLPFLTFAQEDENLKKGNAKEAEKKLIAGNYDEALDDFLSLLADDPQNDKLNYNVGVCYLNIHGNKAKAIPYL
ncbi:MAG: tetratricopeptide repeat protein, partial [Bacteroidia bacterium]